MAFPEHSDSDTSVMKVAKAETISMKIKNFYKIAVINRTKYFCDCPGKNPRMVPLDRNIFSFLKYNTHTINSW